MAAAAELSAFAVWQPSGRSVTRRNPGGEGVAPWGLSSVEQMRCRGKVVGILDGQGHLAMKAAPKWFAREIVGFLEEHDITRRSDTQGSHQDKPAMTP